MLTSNRSRNRVRKATGYRAGLQPKRLCLPRFAEDAFEERLANGKSRAFDIAVNGPLIVNQAAVSLTAGFPVWA
jgi:hypothetical protein